MSLKPWREIIVPHPDVLNGTFQQSEFAADLTAVRTGRATPEYGDARAFYERTFITEGMSKLLIQVSHRLVGRGGELHSCSDENCVRCRRDTDRSHNRCRRYGRRRRCVSTRAASQTEQNECVQDGGS